MNEQPHCRKCGTLFPADAPAGLCPKCLVQAGLESEPGPHPRPAATVSSAAFTGFEPLSVEDLAGKFPQLEILELLGKGGMGAVYKARQRSLDRLVAVKILPPEIGRDGAFAERFTREARVLARLSHNHIVSVFEFGQSDGLFYIVMEYVDGVNLRQTIQAGKLSPAEALAIVPQICEALQFAHDEGFVHRDIKPENILIDKRGQVKIADFGLAKLMASGGRESPDASLTATHQVMGTLRYMAPEQMLGTREVDHRADIYSLGVIFYELLTGELPMGKFAPPSKKVQIDVRLDEIVLRALEQHPEQRYQHASEIKSELDSMRTSAPSIPQSDELKDPLEAFRGLSRFAMTPQPGYGKQVVVPMVVLFLLWIAATITVHVVYGQKENYREGPILLVQGGGMLLYMAIIFVLNLRFAARKRLVQSSLAAPFLPPSEPRFSRFAILGAVWALFGVLAILPTLFFIGLSRVWNGTALPTDIIYEQPPLAFTIFMGALLAIGAGAPLGTTIYGAIAIGHIKRSGGRIIGLPLAVADVLFFPLLAVFAGIAVPLALTLHSVLPVQLVVVAVPSAVLALIVCVVIGNAVWREVSGHSEASAAKKAWRRSWLLAVLAAIMLILACGVGWIQHNSSPPASKVPAVPPLKTITSGYGVQFLVPAGNVAVFEIVTRQGNATVPVPTHCGYVMASQETPMDGTFLWSHMEEDSKAADGRPVRGWQIEIRTAGGGGGLSEGFLLPEGLDSAVGASSIWLGDLEPNEERVYWGGSVDASNLPASGLIGLRVTVVPHGQNRSGTGISHTDWKSEPKSSTTRRKLEP